MKKSFMAADVLSGKTFSNSSSAGLIGTIPWLSGDNQSTTQAACCDGEYCFTLVPRLCLGTNTKRLCLYGGE